MRAKPLRDPQTMARMVLRTLREAHPAQSRVSRTYQAGQTNIKHTSEEKAQDSEFFRRTIECGKC